MHVSDANDILIDSDAFLLDILVCRFLAFFLKLEYLKQPHQFGPECRFRNFKSCTSLLRNSNNTEYIINVQQVVVLFGGERASL